MTIRQESVETFLAAAPVSEQFREHLRYATPALLDPNNPANIVILSNGFDTAAAYRRCAGPMRAWRQFVQYLPGTSPKRAAEAVRDMAQWMFEHLGASSILASTGSGNDLARAFSEAAGATLVSHNEGEAIYQIAGRLH